MTATHKTPDTNARQYRFHSRNINTTDQPHKMKNMNNNRLKTVNSHFARAGALRTLYVPTTIIVCHANKNTQKSNKTTKKRRVSCEMRLLGSGSWLGSITMAVNVKPEKRDNMVTRVLDRSLTYSMYSSSFSVTSNPT